MTPFDDDLLPMFPATVSELDAADAAKAEMMSTATPERIAEVMERAADVLETDGWNQDDYYDVDPEGDLVTSWCAVGALRRATGFYDQKGNSPKSDVFGLPWRESWLAASLLSLQLPQDRYRDLPMFNDESGREAHEVIDLMKHTAKDLRNGAITIPRKAA